MNRYPTWKYLLITLALLMAVVYALPNLFGETPAVQISPVRATLKADTTLLAQVENTLKKAQIPTQGVMLDGNGIKVRLGDTELQLKAKDSLQRELGENYVVALNLLSASPTWLSRLHAQPMFLGLDLRGGVHFLLQVDMQGALNKAVERYAGDVRTFLREKKLNYNGIERNREQINVKFSDQTALNAAAGALKEAHPELQANANGDMLVLRLKPETKQRVQKLALEQNITTLRNRVNELGVAEPIIQQQGLDRIVVQLPGVQDTAKAKDILGRTATLEIRMVDDDETKLSAAMQGQAVAGTEVFQERGGSPVLVKKQVVLTGDYIADAQAGFEQQTSQPAVHLTLDGRGARLFKQVTKDNVGKRMAILLLEKGKGEVITAPVIREEIGGGRVQISGSMTSQEANDTALLLRAGSLAAPMDIVEERTVGPSLGKDNIARGFYSTLYGFAALSLFMIFYYRVFGVVSVLALGANMLFLIALLSMLQATLTLPGIAAIALTLGMAIDANVLINERIREELRNGAPPHSAIQAGYERAFDTILDSNVTTLIAGIALFLFGSGPVRGFAVVHCLGILTSMFSAVMVSRGLVALIYGRKRRLQRLAV